MNLVEFLERRLAAPSNGLITREDIFGSVSEDRGGRFIVEYQIYDTRQTVIVEFGRESLLGYSLVSKASAYANLVRYGWELVGLGVQTVVVTIDGQAWVCSKSLHVDDWLLARAIRTLSECVSFQFTGGVPVELFCDATRVGQVWFDYPGKPAARNAYLANLSRNLSDVLGRPIQLGLKNLEGITRDLRVLDLPTVTSVETLVEWKCQDVPLERLRAFLRNSSIKLLHDYILTAKDVRSDPSVVLTLRVAGQEWLLPLYSDQEIGAETITRIETLVEDALYSARTAVVSGVTSVKADSYRLDID